MTVFLPSLSILAIFTSVCSTSIHVLDIGDKVDGDFGDDSSQTLYRVLVPDDTAIEMLQIQLYMKDKDHRQIRPERSSLALLVSSASANSSCDLFSKFPFSIDDLRHVYYDETFDEALAIATRMEHWPRCVPRWSAGSVDATVAFIKMSPSPGAYDFSIKLHRWDARFPVSDFRYELQVFAVYSNQVTTISTAGLVSSIPASAHHWTYFKFIPAFAWREKKGNSKTDVTGVFYYRFLLSGLNGLNNSTARYATGYIPTLRISDSHMNYLFPSSREGSVLSLPLNSYHPYDLWTVYIAVYTNHSNNLSTSKMSDTSSLLLSLTHEFSATTYHCNQSPSIVGFVFDVLFLATCVLVGRQNMRVKGTDFVFQAQRLRRMSIIILISSAVVQLILVWSPLFWWSATVEAAVTGLFLYAVLTINKRGCFYWAVASLAKVLWAFSCCLASILFAIATTSTNADCMRDPPFDLFIASHLLLGVVSVFETICSWHMHQSIIPADVWKRVSQEGLLKRHLQTESILSPLPLRKVSLRRQSSGPVTAEEMCRLSGSLIADNLKQPSWRQDCMRLRSESASTATGSINGDLTEPLLRP
eukprot:GILJ01005606.1.p1 GENE.GILJ01005606.1~~GILJ01005606.1.p1  ORF type:complete len:587 (-),score=59.08 GILJ01005606.1:286-2046(-)